jgi:hypothetical protein
MIEVTIIAPQAATRAKKTGPSVNYYHPLIPATGLSTLKLATGPPHRQKEAKFA